MGKRIMDLSTKSTRELVALYSDILAELRKKERHVLRTKNFLGDLGEYLVEDHYMRHPALPNVKRISVGAKNVDAKDEEGSSYSIKSVTSTTTGTFHGLPEPPHEPSSPLFDYLIIAKFNDTYQLEMIIELDWVAFLKHKKWRKRMKAFNLVLSKKLLKDAKVVLQPPTRP